MIQSLHLFGQVGPSNNEQFTLHQFSIVRIQLKAAVNTKKEALVGFLILL
jgi:hypothetical protein